MSFADLLRLHGHRNGRPGAPSKAERARILRDATLDECLAAGFCECGTPLDAHPPLPSPGPLRSWASAHALDATLSENGTRAVAMANQWHL